MCGFITSCVCKNARSSSDIHGHAKGLTNTHVVGQNGNGHVNGIVTNGNARLSNGTNGIKSYTNGAHAHPKGDTSAKQHLTKQLQAAVEKIRHRGPDGTGVWVNSDATVGLGHCRLSINDLTPSGAQPLHSDDGLIHAVVNGEVYDFDRLRRECTEKYGYVFSGESDSELVIALYKIHGAPRFLEDMRGEFSFVLYDEREGSRRMIAGRDRYGIKPLFWTVVGDKVLFAAESKAFLSMGWKPEWDVRGITDVGWALDDRTMFKGVRKLMPGNYIEVTDERGVEIKEYWEMDYPDKTTPDPRSVDEMVQEVRERMVQAIRLRLRADVPIGIYLSGGIDSSTVAGVVTKLIREEHVKLGSETASRVKCFSIQFPEETGYNEGDIASRTTEWLGVESIKCDVDEQRLANDFIDASYHTEHHHMDLNSVAKFALSTLPREHGIKVVLTGEGSDEHFAGYSWFPVEYLRYPDKGMPDALLTQDDELRKSLQASALQETKAIWRAQGANEFNGGDAPSNSEIGTYALGNTFPESLMALQPGGHVFSSWVKDQYGGRWDMRETMMNSHAPDIRAKMHDKWHPAHTAMYMWNKSALANVILTCMGDRTEMAHSIEARTPFLDHKLTEYVNSLPPTTKMRYQPPTGVDGDVHNFWWKMAGSALRMISEKWILREAAKPFITEELYVRRKLPFLAPVRWPKDGPIQHMFKRLLTREAVEELGFVDWKFIEKSLETGFGDDGDPSAFRALCCAGGWVTLSQRFGVKKATVEENGWA